MSKIKLTRIWEGNRDDLLDILYILLAMAPVSLLIWWGVNL